MSENEHRENNIQLKAQIESLKDSADEATYQAKSSQAVFLLAGELLEKYSQELLDDGRISHKDQIIIFKKIKDMSGMIVDAVNEASIAFQKMHGK